MESKRNRRKDIASAALAEFAAHGFAGARIERIARTANVNKQLVFYYFGSKAGLYGSVIADSRDALVREWEARDRRAERSTELLRTAFTSFAESLAANPHLIRLVVQDAGQSELAKSLAASVVEAGVSRISGVISKGQGLGYFRDDADPTAVARHAVVLAIGYLGILRSAADADGGAAEPDWIGGATELLMRGLAW